jgi:hypothetical protein
MYTGTANQRGWEHSWNAWRTHGAPHNTSDDDKTTVAVSYRCRATEPCGSNVHSAHVSVFSTVVSEQLLLTACLRRHFVNYGQVG